MVSGILFHGFRCRPEIVPDTFFGVDTFFLFFPFGNHRIMNLTPYLVLTPVFGANGTEEVKRPKAEKALCRPTFNLLRPSF